MKTSSVVLAIILSVSAAVSARAQAINGGIAVGGTGSFTSSSLTLNSPGLVQSSTGDLSTADSLSFATLSTATVSGLSTTALTLTTPIADYFEFSSAGIAGSTGTTPANRFDFELTSLTEVTTTPLAEFTGTGILSDFTNTLAPSYASFTLGFSGSTSESFSLNTTGAVPEPNSWMMGAFACGLFGLLRLVRTRRA